MKVAATIKASGTQVMAEMEMSSTRIRPAGVVHIGVNGGRSAVCGASAISGRAGEVIAFRTVTANFISLTLCGCQDVLT